MRRVEGEIQRLSRGTVEQVGGWWRNRYRARVVDPVTGEIQVRELNRGIATVTEVRSRQQAARLLDQQLARDSFETMAPGERIGAVFYSEQFIRETVAGYRPASVRAYTRAIRRDLQPAMGALKLDELSAGWLRGVMAAKARTHAQASVSFVRKVGLQLLRQAARDGYCVRTINPADARLPKTQQVQAEPPMVNDEALAALLKGTAFPLRAMIALGGWAGLRAGEILGVCWADVDLTEGEGLLTVRRQAQDGRLVPTKTSTSSTALPMLSPLEDVLREYREQWVPNEAGLLFATRKGRPLSAGDVRSRLWRPALVRLGLPHAGLHALRHGLPRRLLAKGVSAQSVMRLMRHRDLKMTTKYHHYGADELRRDLVAAGAISTPREPQP